MSVLFNHARRYDLYDRNPIQWVRQSAKRRSAPDVLTSDEVRQLLAALEPRERIMVLLDVATGLRQSVLFALKWKYVDFKNKQLALSGIVARDEATLRARNPANATAASDENDLMIREPALRRFHQGATLNLAYEIYSAPIDQATLLPQLVTQLRLYHDGKPIYVGTPRPVDVAGQKDLQRIMANARLQLGSEMPPGEYVVQIIVQYELAKEKQRTVTQWIDFEIVK